MNAVPILIAREYTTRVRERSFWIGTALGLVFIIAMSFLPALFRLLAHLTNDSVGVTSPQRGFSARIAEQIPRADFKVQALPFVAQGPALPPEAKKMLDERTIDHVVVAYRAASGILAFKSYDGKPLGSGDYLRLRNAFQRIVIADQARNGDASRAAKLVDFRFEPVNVNPRYRSGADQFIAQGLVYFLIIFMYVAIIMYGMFVAQGVIEEKSNRVMEVMIGAVRPTQLLAGKIFGIGAVALTQLSLYVLASVAMLFVQGTLMPHAAVQPPTAPGANGLTPSTTDVAASLTTVPIATLVYLVVFFLLGFFSYAALFSMVGAVSSKAEDIQQTAGILFLPLYGAFFLAMYALANPDSPVVVAASFIPGFSPLLMFARAALSTVPWWQITASIALSLAAIYALSLAAGKLYRIGVLMYGKPPNLREMLKAMRAGT